MVVPSREMERGARAAGGIADAGTRPALDFEMGARARAVGSARAYAIHAVAMTTALGGVAPTRGVMMSWQKVRRAPRRRIDGWRE